MPALKVRIDSWATGVPARKGLADMLTGENGTYCRTVDVCSSIDEAVSSSAYLLFGKRRQVLIACSVQFLPHVGSAFHGGCRISGKERRHARLAALDYGGAAVSDLVRY